MAGRGWPPTQRPSYQISSTDSKITGVRKPGNKVQNSAPQVKSVAVYFNNAQSQAKTNTFPEKKV